MKATINPKDEFAKRHKKYHISFDDNEPIIHVACLLLQRHGETLKPSCNPKLVCQGSKARQCRCHKSRQFSLEFIGQRINKPHIGKKFIFLQRVEIVALVGLRHPFNM